VPGLTWRLPLACKGVSVAHAISADPGQAGYGCLLDDRWCTRHQHPSGTDGARGSSLPATGQAGRASQRTEWLRPGL